MELTQVGVLTIFLNGDVIGNVQGQQRSLPVSTIIAREKVATAAHQVKGSPGLLIGVLAFATSCLSKSVLHCDD